MCSLVHIIQDSCPESDLSHDKRSEPVLPGGALRFTRSSGLQTVVPIISCGLLVRVALHLVEFDAVQLLKPLVTKLTGVVVVRLWSVFLHVPVQRGALSTLVAANFTPRRGEKKKKEKKNGAKIARRLHRCSRSRHITYWRGVSPVCVRLWTSR